MYSCARIERHLIRRLLPTLLFVNSLVDNLMPLGPTANGLGMGGKSMNDAQKRWGDRAFGNMIEQAPMFLSSLWLHALFVSSTVATQLGAIYLALRLCYPIIWHVHTTTVTRHHHCRKAGAVLIGGCAPWCAQGRLGRRKGGAVQPVHVEGLRQVPRHLLLDLPAVRHRGRRDGRSPNALGVAMTRPRARPLMPWRASLVHAG
jgi:hypothetical protein